MGGGGAGRRRCLQRSRPGRVASASQARRPGISGATAGLAWSGSSGAGFAGVRVLNYGLPVGYALEHARNVLARRPLRASKTYEERTRASGRWLQSPDWATRLTQVAAYPLCELQRPFVTHDLGTGPVALALLRGRIT